ncbi:MAG: hypothetical protein FWD17_10850 [Polyangiaceae bacterium]|nr:hypothetical protein [Polyangiaceae bacterium]
MRLRRRMALAASLGIAAGAAAIGCNKTDAPTNATPGATRGPGAPAAKHACRGKNDCKGQGGCATDMHGCKGQNACKGQGGCSMS